MVDRLLARTLPANKCLRKPCGESLAKNRWGSMLCNGTSLAGCREGSWECLANLSDAARELRASMNSLSESRGECSKTACLHACDSQRWCCASLRPARNKPWHSDGDRFAFKLVMPPPNRWLSLLNFAVSTIHIEVPKSTKQEPKWL